MKRREFIKNGIVVSSGVIFVNSVSGCINPALEAGSMDKIFKGFQNPPVDSHLFVRWWWNGNRLSKQEIAAYNANPENTYKIVCEKHKPVGSNILKTECYKVSKANERRSQDQDALRRIQMNTTSSSPSK